MESLKKSYLIAVIDPEEEEVIGMMPAEAGDYISVGPWPEIPEREMDPREEGPALFFPQDRENLHELREQARQREMRDYIRERMKRWKC